MSTRCQIKLKNPDEDCKIFIYKHSDGMPERVLPVLVPFVLKFFANRGYDDSYLLAQIVRHFAVHEYKEGQAAKARGEKYGVPDEGNSFPYTEYTGWGLDTVQHGDIEYLYEIEGGNVFVNGKKLTLEQLIKYSGGIV